MFPLRPEKHPSANLFYSSLVSGEESNYAFPLFCAQVSMHTVYCRSWPAAASELTDPAMSFETEGKFSQSHSQGTTLS